MGSGSVSCSMPAAPHGAAAGMAGEARGKADGRTENAEACVAELSDCAVSGGQGSAVSSGQSTGQLTRGRMICMVAKASSAAGVMVSAPTA